jgi:hypothetical protein
MNQRMPATAAALPAPVLALILLTLAACSSDRLGVIESSAPAPGPVPVGPSAPPVNLAGRWLLSSPGRGQCNVTLGAATATASQGTIAPEGGCPGKFFTSRKWTYEQSGLVIRDHNGQPLAHLSGGGAQFTGKSTAGEPVTLIR